MPGNPAKPTAPLRGGAEAVDLLMRAHEGFLRCIVSIRVGSEVTATAGVDSTMPSAHELAEGAMIASLRTLNPLGPMIQNGFIALADAGTSHMSHDMRTQTG